MHSIHLRSYAEQIHITMQSRCVNRPYRPKDGGPRVGAAPSPDGSTVLPPPAMNDPPSSPFPPACNLVQSEPCFGNECIAVKQEIRLVLCNGCGARERAVEGNVSLIFCLNYFCLFIQSFFLSISGQSCLHPFLLGPRSRRFKMAEKVCL